MQMTETEYSYTMKILEKGLTFNNGRNNTIEEEVIELETACRNHSLHHTTRATATHNTLNLLKKHTFKSNDRINKRISDFSTSFSRKELMTFQTELKDKDVIVVRADRGG